MVLFIAIGEHEIFSLAIRALQEIIEKHWISRSFWLEGNILILSLSSMPLRK